jgi:Mn2+/Fe2+ NRAMP family transporter
MVTGEGLARALSNKYPATVVALACVALMAANTVNVAGDLAGIGGAFNGLCGIPAAYSVPILGILVDSRISRHGCFAFSRIAWIGSRVE